MQPEPAKRTVTVTPPQVAHNETQIWWQWTRQSLAAQKTEIKKFINSETECHDEIWHEVIGKVIADERKDMRATVKREGDAIKGEFEQRVRELAVSLKEQVLESGRALREEITAADEAARPKGKPDSTQRKNLGSELSCKKLIAVVLREGSPSNIDLRRASNEQHRFKTPFARIRLFQTLIPQLHFGDFFNVIDPKRILNYWSGRDL